MFHNSNPLQIILRSLQMKQCVWAPR